MKPDLYNLYCCSLLISPKPVSDSFFGWWLYPYLNTGIYLSPTVTRSWNYQHYQQPCFMPVTVKTRTSCKLCSSALYPLPSHLEAKTSKNYLECGVLYREDNVWFEWHSHIWRSVVICFNFPLSFLIKIFSILKS